MKLPGIIRLFNIGHVQISIHWSIIFFLIFCYPTDYTIPGSIIAFVFTFPIIIVHEYGHFFMAKLLGYKTFGIVFHALGGYCEIEYPDNKHDGVMISWGGVLFQLIVLFLALIVLLVLSILHLEKSMIYFAIYLRFVGINLIIIILNVIPFPYFDGDRMWKIFGYLKNIRERIELKKLRIKKNRGIDSKSIMDFQKEIDRIMKKR